MATKRTRASSSKSAAPGSAMNRPADARVPENQAFNRGDAGGEVPVDAAPGRRCAVMDVHRRLLREVPGYAAARLS